MKERPILFNAEMVRAILDGHKTQTRRAVKPQPQCGAVNGNFVCLREHNHTTPHGRITEWGAWDYSWRLSVPAERFVVDGTLPPCPYGQPGDRLWGVTMKPILYGAGRFGAGDDGKIYRIDGPEPIQMRPRISHNGYEEITLRFKGDAQPFRVNRLVAEAFYRVPMANEVCRHLNGSRRDNRPENLDWGSPKQNSADAAAAGSFSGMRGSQSFIADEAVEEIRASNEPQKVLARRYGTTQPTISKIRSGKRRGLLPVTPPPNLKRWASRITLEIVSVKVERLQDISEEDAKAEGVELEACRYVGRCNSSRCLGHSYCHGYAKLWDSIYAAKHPWASNPWVWVVEFRRVQP